MPRYSAYSYTSASGLLKPWAAWAASAAAMSLSPGPEAAAFFQPSSVTTALGGPPLPPPSSKAAAMLRTEGPALGPAPPSAAGAPSARFLRAWVRSKLFWRAMLNFCCLRAASSWSALACAASRFSRSASSAARRRSASSAALRAASACLRSASAACFTFWSLRRARRRRASTPRARAWRKTARCSTRRMRAASKESSTPTARKARLCPMRYLSEGTPAFLSTSSAPPLPWRGRAPLGPGSAKEATSVLKGTWSGKPARAACTACTTPEVRSWRTAVPSS
mmetsp:Transcript_1874/g.6190  ORF Transcript_1874/g.6190 Transcript_1874/m.6190 type:complete len:280 (+) Transcript_1874:1360-2199(+)